MLPLVHKLIGSVQEQSKAPPHTLALEKKIYLIKDVGCILDRSRHSKIFLELIVDVDTNDWLFLFGFSIINVVKSSIC